MSPTTRPDPVPPLRALAARIAADRARYARDEAALTAADAARLSRMLAGAGCVGCGRARGPLCETCAAER